MAVDTDDVGPTPGSAGADLSCPLCEYSLRGLVEPRCPECGFAFTWAELAAADRGRHPWLFEHGRRPSLPRLARTWRRNRWPWRFWRDVTPANPVNLRRLLAYWIIVGGLASAALLAPLPHGVWQTWNGSTPGSFNQLTGQFGPSDVDFLAQCDRTRAAVVGDPFSPAVIGPPLLVLAWPWLTAAALTVFRLSMRRARIEPGHVLRLAVYGCDLGLGVWLAVLLAVPVSFYPRFWGGSVHGEPLAYLALACGVLATVRLAVGGRRYLRVHGPLATAVASQVLVVLFVWTCLAFTTDLGHLFR